MHPKSALNWRSQHQPPVYVKTITRTPKGFIDVHLPTEFAEVYDTICDHFKEYCDQLRMAVDVELQRVTNALRLDPANEYVHDWYGCVLHQKRELNTDINYYEIELDDLINRDDVMAFLSTFRSIKGSLQDVYSPTSFPCHRGEYSRTIDGHSDAPMKQTPPKSTPLVSPKNPKQPMKRAISQRVSKVSRLPKAARLPMSAQLLKSCSITTTSTASSVRTIQNKRTESGNIRFGTKLANGKDSPPVQPQIINSARSFRSRIALPSMLPRPVPNCVAAKTQ